MCMYQDSGAFINGITFATAQKANITLQKLQIPMTASFQLRYVSSTVTSPYYVFTKLKLQVVIENRFLYEKSVIGVYETLKILT